MFCPKCGHEFEEDAAFCPFCGTRKPGMTAPEFYGTKEEPPVAEEIPVTHKLPEEPEPVSTNLFTEQKTGLPHSHELEVVVKKNTQYYIGEFEKAANGQRTSFNLMAFFFGAYLCFYRKCTQLFAKYYLGPLIVSLVSWAAAVFGLQIIMEQLQSSAGQADMTGALIALGISFCADLAVIVWSVVNAIRCGRNFNKDYYQHCLSILATDNVKKHGTSIGSMVLYIIASIGLSAILLSPINQLPQIINNAPALWDDSQISVFEGARDWPDGEYDTSRSAADGQNDSGEPESGGVYSIDDVFPALETELMGQTITVTDIFVDDFGGDHLTFTTFTPNGPNGSRYYVNIEFRDEEAYFTATMLLDFTDTFTICGTIGEYSVTDAWIPDWFAEEVFYGGSDRFIDDPTGTPDDLSYFEGEYHMAHYYPMRMDLWFPYDAAGTSWRNWKSSDTAEVNFSFSEGGELIGSGIAYWYPPGSEYPDFEGQLDNSDVEVTIAYDGYNFIVNCPELELYDDSFFKEY